MARRPSGEHAIVEHDLDNVLRTVTTSSRCQRPRSQWSPLDWSTGLEHREQGADNRQGNVGEDIRYGKMVAKPKGERAHHRHQPSLRPLRVAVHHRNCKHIQSRQPFAKCGAGLSNRKF